MSAENYALTPVQSLGREEGALPAPLPALPQPGAAPQAPDPIPETAVSLAEARRTAERLNGVLARFDRTIRIEVEDVDGRRQVKVVDEGTKRTVKMLPPEGLRELSDRIEMAMGVLLDSQG